MSEWIESFSSLPRHRKTRRLASQLEIPIPLTVGYLHMLWYYVLDFAPGGDLSKHRPEDIALGCEWPGDAGEFVDALVVAEWLDADDEGLFIHDWDEHNQSHRKRQQDAERQRQKRARDKESCAVSRDVTVMPVTVTPDRQTDRTDRQTGESARDNDEPVDNPRIIELLTSIPLWKGGATTARQTVTLFSDLPDVLMEATARNLHAYLVANPTKYKDAHKALVNWLKSERNKITTSTLAAQHVAGPGPRSTLVRPEMVALYAGMVGEGVRLEEMLESCVSDEERTALKAACEEKAA